MASNTVFISYRRDVAGPLAMALHQNLTMKGIDAFYDIENMRAGQFDTIILAEIEARPYFIVILTPGTLQRCTSPEDWLRREIEQALDSNRIIIPAFTPDFDWGDARLVDRAARGSPVHHQPTLVDVRLIECAFARAVAQRGLRGRLEHLM